MIIIIAAHHHYSYFMSIAILHGCSLLSLASLSFIAVCHHDQHRSAVHLRARQCARAGISGGQRPTPPCSGSSRPLHRRRRRPAAPRALIHVPHRLRSWASAAICRRRRRRSGRQPRRFGACAGRSSSTLQAPQAFSAGNSKACLSSLTAMKLGDEAILCERCWACVLHAVLELLAFLLACTAKMTLMLAMLACCLQSAHLVSTTIQQVVQVLLDHEQSSLDSGLIHCVLCLHISAYVCKIALFKHIVRKTGVV